MRNRSEMIHPDQPGTLPRPEEIAQEALAAARRSSFHRLAWQLGVDIEDATNTTVQRALQAAEQYSSTRGDLRSWIAVIFRHALYDLGRQKRRHRACSLSREQAHSLDVPDQQQRPLDMVLIAREQAARAVDLLGKASPLVQEIARLRLEGHTFTQVARLLSLPRARVTSCWFAWCRSVRDELRNEQ